MPLASPIRLDRLSDWERIQAEQLVREMRARKREAAKLRKLLDHGSEAEIIAECRRRTHKKRTAYTLAQTYDVVGGGQEIPSFPRDHPRRPVLMLGSVAALIDSHTNGSWLSANGWARHIFCRYVQMRKITILDMQEYSAFERGLTHRLRAKYRLSYHFDDYARLWVLSPRLYNNYQWQVLIGGKQCWLTQSEYENVSRLHKIIKKTDDLQERYQLVRASSRLRASP